MGKVKEAVVTVIEPGRTERNYLRDLWRFRELLYMLSWRDVKVRYKQTLIGALWVLIRPALTLLIFTLIFGRIAGLPSEGDLPYAVMVLGGVLPWQFFANAVAESSNSLIGNERLITRVYFPRLIIPASSVFTSLVDLLISLLLLGGLLMGYGIPLSAKILLIIPLSALAFLPAMGLGLMLGALNVQFRDFRYIIPFILQLGLFLSPVGFSAAVVPAQWQLAYALNPMVGIINGFRWCITPGNVAAFPGPALALSAGAGLFLLLAGFRLFRKMEKTFADII